MSTPRSAAVRARTSLASLAMLSVVGGGMLATASQAAAQAPGRVYPNTLVRSATTVAPDTVTVGDRFASRVTLALPADARVEATVAEDPTGTIQAIGAVEILPPDRQHASHRLTATLVAWRADTLPEVRMSLTIRYPRDTRYAAIPLALPRVRSVLPPDTAGVKPKPPKDVVGPNWDWRLIAAAIFAASMLLALAAWLFVRWRRRGIDQPAEPATARERALAALEAARASGHAQAGEWSAFYALVSRALRRYAAETDAAWGMDLTTPELLGRMRDDGVPPERVAALATLLGRADLAKFARHRLTLEVAERDVDDARGWVEALASPAAAPALEPVGAGAP